MYLVSFLKYVDFIIPARWSQSLIYFIIEMHNRRFLTISVYQKRHDLLFYKSEQFPIQFRVQQKYPPSVIQQYTTKGRSSAYYKVLFPTSVPSNKSIKDLW